MENKGGKVMCQIRLVLNGNFLLGSNFTLVSDRN